MLRIILFLSMLALSNGQVAPLPEEPVTEVDKTVIDAALRHVLALPRSELPLLPEGGTEIVLHERIPEKTGLIEPAQWESYETDD